MIKKDKPNIDIALVQRLIRRQFPTWAHLAVVPVLPAGWDNRTFRLGKQLLIRLPSDSQYASQVKKEHDWLPKLREHLPLAIPTPIAMGKPSCEYPWHWSIYQWIAGETAASATISDPNSFAKHLAEFLKALQCCNTRDAPLAGPDNFYRGGSLSVYDTETQAAIAQLANRTLAAKLTQLWEKALVSTWERPPVWVHGDMAVNNLLVANDQLNAVIDFGQLAVGDPACDLAIHWTFLSGESQQVFRQTINLDEDTWHRGRGWVLWKTLCAPIKDTDCNQILKNLLADFNE